MDNSQAQDDTASETKLVEIIIPKESQENNDVAKTENEEIKGGTPSTNKKACVCSKITHEVEEEQIEELEMAEELPEQVIETTSVLVDPSVELDVEAILKENSQDQSNENKKEEDKVVVKIVDPEIKIDKNEVGVGTEDLDYNNDVEKENELLRQQLESLSRDNLKIEFKETQTEFLMNENEAVNFDVEMERAKIQEMLSKFQDQQFSVPLSGHNERSGLNQPMQIEFEIAFDFSQDPTNPNVTLLKTLSSVKDIDSDTAVNQVMSLEMDDGVKVENESNTLSVEQEIVLPLSDSKISTEKNQTDKELGSDQNTEKVSPGQSLENIEPEPEMIEVCDAATSMADLQSSSFEENFSLEFDANHDEPLILCAPVLHPSKTIEESYNEEINERLSCDWFENKSKNLSESSFEENKLKMSYPLVASRTNCSPSLPRCLFRELDSIVRSIAQVYSHYENFLGKEVDPTLTRPSKK